MARKRNKGGRVSTTNASRRLPRLNSSRSFLLPALPMTSVEDRRTFHPDGLNRPFASFSRPRHRLEVTRALRQNIPATSSLLWSVPKSVSFVAPKRVLTCVRRSIRKQVIFATGYSGRNGAKKYSRNSASQISCR